MTHSKWIHGTGVPTFPKDPGSPSENGFMEPKGPVRFGGDEGHPNHPLTR